MTDSGYPRVMREWHRGTPLAAAPIVHEGQQSDVAAYMYVAMHREHKYLLRGRSVTFYTSKNEVFLPGDVPEIPGSWHEIPVPDDAEISVFADQLLVHLRSAWAVGDGNRQPQRTVPQGSLLAAAVRDVVKNGANGENLLCICSALPCSYSY